ncbi:hypothetical protein KAR28_02255 [Candidatus Parcubacteria bacterium]|nr:hypothetical protein [Candidatus Parcubacteria bacterium]
MLKTKRSDFVLVVIVIFSMLAMYAYMPMAQADSMDSAKTTLSDSDIDITATSTVEFDLGTAITSGQYIRVTFESGFTDLLTITGACPTDTTASTTGTSDSFRVVECTASAYIEATGTANQIIVQHTNPGSENDYSVTVSTHAANDTEIESSETKVYILNDVEVTATVPATLTFGVDLLGMNSTRNTINGVALTGSSTETALAFGTLDDTSSSTLGHELSVSTNASGGYTVTVQQDAEMTNGAADTINSFFNAPDGQGSTTPDVWGAPSASLGDTETYGHMGVISDDTDNMAVNYSGSKYAGLDAANPIQVMAHNGPTNGSGEAGVAGVAYTVEISSLQEAGDYSSALTYVCTPTY